jgi:hypothetical protein
MTLFPWTDRHGVEHDLDRHDAIEIERRHIRQELLDLRPRLEHADDAIFIAAHGEAVALRARMATLQDDLRRFVRHEAARADTMIGQIELEASFVRDLHRSYDQHGERLADEAALVAPPTADQLSVLRRQAIRDGAQAPIPPSFGEAHAMLLAHPGTCRMPLPGTAPTFEWTDRHMKYHQVHGLRQIEREYVVVAGELARLRPLLAPGIPIRDMLTALEQARVGIDRVAILERAMVRWTAHVIGVARGDHITFLDQLEK